MRAQPPAEATSWIEKALASAPDEPAPGDGLARVMAEIDGSPRAARPQPGWARALAASFSGVVLAAGAIGGTGAWLLGSPQLLGVAIPSLGPVGSVALAAGVFFGLGSFATLALAPVLMLESARRPVGAGR